MKRNVTAWMNWLILYETEKVASVCEHRLGACCANRLV